jgi:hypothetical protein
VILQNQTKPNQALSEEEEKKNPASQTKYEPGYNESIELQIKLSISQVKEKEESVNKIYMYCVLYKKRKEGRS